MVSEIDATGQVRFSWTCNDIQGGVSTGLHWIAKDTTGKTAELSFQVTCSRCKWAVADEKTLADVAWRFDTNWMQLWAMNVDLTHPGRLAQGWKFSSDMSVQEEKVAEEIRDGVATKGLEKHPEEQYTRNRGAGG